MWLVGSCLSGWGVGSPAAIVIWLGKMCTATQVCSCIRLVLLRHHRNWSLLQNLTANVHLSPQFTKFCFDVLFNSDGVVLSAVKSAWGSCWEQMKVKQNKDFFILFFYFFSVDPLFEVKQGQRSLAVKTDFFLKLCSVCWFCEVCVIFNVYLDSKCLLHIYTILQCFHLPEA